MIYSDRDIRRLIADEVIRVDPGPDLDLQLGSCSLDLRLGERFRVFNTAASDAQPPTIDTRNPEQFQQITREVVVNEGEAFILGARSFILGITLERLELADDVVARLEGRSSLGRLGIIVHATASIIDPGWRGQIVLELANHGPLPVALYPGMRICALTFEPLSTPAERPYWRKARAKYTDQGAPLASKIADDPEVHGPNPPGA
ncbi:MAG: dCTP deaminase [Chloroflexi bacterium]|nr:dCTP deaminase [Chloroflexota bacterium]